MNEHQAIVKGRNLPVSTKHMVEIGRYIRGKDLQKMKKELAEVIVLKRAIPFRRHNDNMGHRKGHVGSGRYPKKATQEVIKLLHAVEANAANKGLDTESLFIATVMPNRAAIVHHPGRHLRTRMKRSNMDIIVEEKKIEKKKEQPLEQKQQTKKELKKEIKK